MPSGSAASYTVTSVRLAFIYQGDVPFNAQYRALMPMAMLSARGHDVVWWGPAGGRLPLDTLRGCDLIHTYRAADPEVLAALAELRGAGVALSWDNDDHVQAISRHSPSYTRLGGGAGRRDFAHQRRAIALADLVTTTSRHLAAVFRDAGADRVVLIENFLPPEFLGRPRPPNEGLVIGWAALREHEADAKLLGLRDILMRTLDENGHVRVVALGIDLRLQHARYEHRPVVPFERLADELCKFDIGLVPLADIPFNRSRSNVKAKEYAAAGVPWLASPVGEYAALAAREGGRTVPDERWEQALSHLIGSRRERLVLAMRGRRWARRQTIDVNVHRWETAFREAVGSVQART
jgi:glycosyltransferase involved in cell wall biosynthesis